MVNVVVAGGTSPTLGKSIVSAILATGKHNIIILTRAKPDTKAGTASELDKTTTSNTGPPRPTSFSEVPRVAVDYDSPSSLLSTFQTHKITHLISVLKTIDPQVSLQTHSNLLQAAHDAKLTRFILSDWSLSPISHKRVDLLQHKAELHRLGAEYMAAKNGVDGGHVVECCTVQNGGFLEYFVQGSPAVKSDPDLAAGLVDDMMLEYIDIARGQIVVPCLSPPAGEGQDAKPTPARVSMTSLHDIGKYIAASLDLPKGHMTGYVGIAGHVLKFTDVVSLLSKLDPPIHIIPAEYVTSESCEAKATSAGKELARIQEEENGRFDVGLFIQRMVAQMFGCLCGEEGGGGVVKCDVMLNEVFSEIETVDLEGLLSRAWER